MSAELFQRLPIGVLVVSRVGVILDANPAAMALFGGPIQGESIEALVPEAQRRDHVMLRDRFVKEPKARRMGSMKRPTKALRQDGVVIPVAITLAPYLDDKILVTVQDMNEQERLLHKLATQNDALETSNKELERFAYIASHDLQQPMRTIACFAQILEEDYGEGKVLDDEGIATINFIIQGAVQGQRLINDFLALSRLQQAATKMRDTDMQLLAEGAKLDLAKRIAETDADVEIEELPEAHCDGAQVRQVFANLISNSLKYTRPDETPVVRVTGRLIDDEWVQYAVSDQGRGVRPEDRTRIFGTFERSSNVGSVSGSGIGLAICKKVVSRHKGRIWCSANHPHGSIFYFTLPAAHEPEILH
jgi:two-component system sensor kinase FixL